MIPSFFPLSIFSVFLGQITSREKKKGKDNERIQVKERRQDMKSTFMTRKSLRAGVWVGDGGHLGGPHTCARAHTQDLCSLISMPFASGLSMCVHLSFFSPSSNVIKIKFGSESFP